MILNIKNPASAFRWAAIALLALKWAAQFSLNRLNQRNVLAHADERPREFEAFIEPDVYRKSVAYTLAKIRFHQFELGYDLFWLLAVLLSRLLPASFQFFQNAFGASVWSMAGWLFSLGLLFALAQLPLEWRRQFSLEEKFGFNAATARTWWMDRVKGFFLALILGLPLLALILKWADWAGAAWWIWAWGTLTAAQLIMALLAPILILPLFNKLTPLEPGPLKERLERLAEKTRFHTRAILVMDGSKRSRHSNAFFTGFGRFRKIALFDTLLQQTAPEELEAVLAHEIGHFRKRHIPKMLAASSAASLAAFALMAWLARQSWFAGAFELSSATLAPTLALFALLGGAVSFWLSPLGYYWSRRHEHQADAFAAEVLGESRPMITALQKLNRENLSNLTPHPLYSAVYYSHPTLLERIQALSEQKPDIRSAKVERT